MRVKKKKQLPFYQPIPKDKPGQFIKQAGMDQPPYTKTIQLN
jgi:hypothetical protein